MLSSRKVYVYKETSGYLDAEAPGLYSPLSFVKDKVSLWDSHTVCGVCVPRFNFSTCLRILVKFIMDLTPSETTLTSYFIILTIINGNVADVQTSEVRDTLALLIAGS
jgi:hypothetical protein